MPRPVIRAKESIILKLASGFPRTIGKGRVYSADDDVVKEFPQFFEAWQVVPVEQATAAPGEQRHRLRERAMSPREVRELEDQ